MKITIYELLGLVKDGKAPKKIKTNTGIFKLEIGYDQLRYRCNDGGILTFDYYIENNKLNNEVEIIEEEKKIEKIEKLNLPSFEELKNMSVAESYLVIAKEYDVLNELIDEINNLKEND